LNSPHSSGKTVDAAFIQNPSITVRFPSLSKNEMTGPGTCI